MSNRAPSGLYSARLSTALETLARRVRSLEDQMIYQLARHDEAHRQGRHGSANFHMGFATGLRMARAQCAEDEIAIEHLLRAP